MAPASFDVRTHKLQVGYYPSAVTAFSPINSWAGGAPGACCPIEAYTTRAMRAAVSIP